MRSESSQPTAPLYDQDAGESLDHLKFLTYLDKDGFPWIIPFFQAQAHGTCGLLLSSAVFGHELSAIPSGSPVAVLGLALTMEDVLVLGVYRGGLSQAGSGYASIAVDWVYNAMPPGAWAGLHPGGNTARHVFSLIRSDDKIERRFHTLC